MSNDTRKKFNFPVVKCRKVSVEFSGGYISSDAGGLLLSAADKKINLLQPLASLFPDLRDPLQILHTAETMLKQRVYGIALGYEDLNDHNFLRKDISFQTIVGADSELASSPTLCRFEKCANREIAVAINKQMVEVFIASFKEAPAELILDFDATENPIYGEQDGKYYNGFYRSNCFLPLHVFCGKALLVNYLRTSKTDGAHHSWAILSLLVKRFRQVWPDVKIIFRADGGFCRPEILTWCEKKSVGYIVGMAGNPRLLAIFEPQIKSAERAFEFTKVKQRIFGKFMYAAQSWSTKRQIMGKAEHTEKGANPRFIVTNLATAAPKSLVDESQELYDHMYCPRGDAENRIKDLKSDLSAGRTSSHDWWPNQLRALLSSLAYVLINYIRTNALVGTELANAQMGTIRSKLFKIGAVVYKTIRRVHFVLSRYYPMQDAFAKAYSKIVDT
jgi:Transposase DDE domain group 1